MVGRLLIPDGRLVALCTHPERVKGAEDLAKVETVLCTITAVDPATGYFFAMGHDAGRNLVGRYGYPTLPPPELRSCYDACPAILRLRVPQPCPLCGPILAQNSYGIIGRFPAAYSYAAARPTATPADGEAVLLTGRQNRGAGVDWIRGRIVRPRKGGKYNTTCFMADGVLLKGMSGSPILQGGAIVGVLWGVPSEEPKNKSRVGFIKPIDSVVNGLLREVKDVGVGQSKKHGAGQGGSGRTVARKGQAKKQGERAAEVRTFWARHERAHTGAIFYRQLIRDGEKIAELERQVRLYEHGRAGEGILLGGRRLSYKEALTTIWRYYTTRARMALYSNVAAGLLTAGEYRGIIDDEV